MKNLITYLSKKSLSLGNGSGMTRKWFGNGSGMTRFSLASLICLCMLTIGSGNVWAGNEVYKTALFGSSYNSAGVQNYTSTWYSTNSGFRVDITNANNNNNGWSYIKMGSKNAASVGKITTNAAIDKKITQVRLTIDAVTANNINSIKLYKSTNKSTWTELGSYTVGTGAKDVAIAAGNQATNLYYEIRVDCKKSSNGVITISKVEYYIDGVTTTTVLLNKNTGTTNGSAEFSLGESSYNSFTAAVPASCKICTGYWTATSGGNKVLNPDGSFAADNVSGWVTSGKWSKDANSATLYAQWADEIYSVTLKDNNATLTQASCGASVTLPSRAGCTGYTFAGWSTTNNTSWTTTTPTIIPAGSYTPTTDENLYPVYTKEESGGTVFSQYQQVSLGGTITAGKYLISTGTFTMAGSGKTGASFTPGTTEKTEYEYTIAISGGAITIKGPDNKYVGGTDTNDGLTFDAATPSTNQYKWTYNSTGIRNNNVTTRYIRAYSTTDFRHYKSGVGTTTYFYKRIETSGSTTSYISVPNCCATKVTLSGGSPSNGTVTFSPAGPIATCSATDADRQTIMTITPAAGYKLTAFSKTGPTPTMSADVATTGASSKAAQNITLTFAQDQATATYAVTATFTAMVDHYKDLLHSTSGYTGDGMSKSATYTVPSPGNASNPADDSCEELHYKFVGWVEESYVKSDGTLNTGYTLISGGSAGTASEKTYIAVWAKEL